MTFINRRDFPPGGLVNPIVGRCGSMPWPPSDMSRSQRSSRVKTGRERKRPESETSVDANSHYGVTGADALIVG